MHPKVPGTKMDVPVGPTGHLKSSRKPTRPGGTRRPTHGSRSGLVGSPMRPVLGKR